MARKGNGGEEKEEVLKVEKGGKDISFPTPACHLNKGGGREIERGTGERGWSFSVETDEVHFFGREGS